jgi:diguanylate cyclase (GGDEF)-like protein/PAS domain S-box-containing protein
MGNKLGLTKDNTVLRRHAEQRLDTRAVDDACIADAELRKLLHELQVHQIELELQNEELQQARKTADTALQQYTELYDFAPVGYFTLGRDALIRRVNLAGAGLLGIERSKLMSRHFGFFLDEDNRPAFIALLDRVFAAQGKQSSELSMSVQGGITRFVHVEAVADASGQSCQVVMADITERKLNEEALEIAASVHQAIGEAVMIADANNRIIAINPAFTRITGYTPHDAIGERTDLLKSGRQDKSFYQTLWHALESTGHWQGEIWNRRKNGEIYPEWLSIHSIYDQNGGVMRRVAMFSDITDKKRAEETIWRQANYDMLTGLPNRRLFRDRLMQKIKKAERGAKTLALLFIDLDHFKEVNDTLGHQMGDLLLVEAANRIVSCVRESDTVARLGGDEFTVILTNLDNTNRVDLIAQNIIDKLLVPFHLGDEKAFVSASIGITLYPNDAGLVEDLLKHADQAMYVAKSAGRNRFSYFTRALQEAAEARVRLSNDLRTALAEDQFRVYYQPIVELMTGSVHKAEALIRWQHPIRGLVSPAEFIPLAEDTGLIIEIGNWIFKQVVKQVKHLREMQYPDFQVSINKSPVQFRKDKNNINETWLAHLQRMGVSGQSISIEITESLLLDAEANVTDKLLAFRDAGISVSLDDFGTGYSSLSYLRKFHIDYLKIDQSFVHDLEHDANDVALCEAIIAMAHKLGIKVIAEGVETGAQRDFLTQAGCNYAQGYLCSKPVPVDEFEKLLGKWAETVRPSNSAPI